MDVAAAGVTTNTHIANNNCFIFLMHFRNHGAVVTQNSPLKPILNWNRVKSCLFIINFPIIAQLL